MSSNDKENGVPNWLLFLFFGSIIVGSVYGAFLHGFVQFQPGEGHMQATSNSRFVTWVPSKPARSAAEIAKGKQLSATCVACHGDGMKGRAGQGPNLLDATWLHGTKTESSLASLIITGISGSRLKAGAMPMPAMGSLQSEADVWRVVYYLSSVNKSIAQK